MPGSIAVPTIIDVERERSSPVDDSRPSRVPVDSSVWMYVPRRRDLDRLGHGPRAGPFRLSLESDRSGEDRIDRTALARSRDERPRAFAASRSPKG
jgi:hypothetical protein